MYRDLGIHWAAALPGFIALACIPFAWIFYKYGARIRAKCRYAADAERQMAIIMAAHKKRNEDVEKASEAPDAPGATDAPGASGLETPVQTSPQSDDEWTIYRTLADRDEVDLNDEERVRLQALHDKFRRPSSASVGTAVDAEQPPKQQVDP